MISLFPIPKECKTTQGGLKRIFIAKYTKHKRSQISVSDMNLNSIPETTFYEIDEKGSYTQSISDQNGAVFFNQNISVQIKKVYGKFNISNLLKSEYRVIVLTENNQYLIFGLYNGLKIKLNNNSGGTKQDFNGFDMAFDGLEEDFAYLITDLAAAGITIIGTDGDFNNDFNNDFFI